MAESIMNNRNTRSTARAPEEEVKISQVCIDERSVLRTVMESPGCSSMQYVNKSFPGGHTCDVNAILWRLKQRFVVDFRKNSDGTRSWFPIQTTGKGFHAREAQRMALKPRIDYSQILHGDGSRPKPQSLPQAVVTPPLTLWHMHQSKRRMFSRNVLKCM